MRACRFGSPGRRTSWYRLYSVCRGRRSDRWSGRAYVRDKRDLVSGLRLARAFDVALGRAVEVPLPRAHKSLLEECHSRGDVALRRVARSMNMPAARRCAFSSSLRRGGRRGGRRTGNCTDDRRGESAFRRACRRSRRRPGVQVACGSRSRVHTWPQDDLTCVKYMSNENQGKTWRTYLAGGRSPAPAYG